MIDAVGPSASSNSDRLFSSARKEKDDCCAQHSDDPPCRAAIDAEDTGGLEASRCSPGP
jgi:hypothetical protein